jgi:hypothetical protein
MYPRKDVDGNPAWKYEELPPAALIESLHLEVADGLLARSSVGLPWF